MSTVDEVHRRLWQRDEVLDLDGLDAEIDRLVRLVDPLASTNEHRRLAQEVRARVDGLGPLQQLADDPSVSEIMVNAGSTVWVERDGSLHRSGVTLDPLQAEHLVRRLASAVGRRIDRSSPMVDVRLADGSRLHAVLPPLAVDGLCITIRRFRSTPVALEEMADAPVADFLRQAIASSATILIAGSTGSGKTTLLNALVAHVPKAERLVTIEDSAELQLRNDHVVRLESQPEGSDHPGVDLRQLVRNALRMRPDRLICGEMRGAEAFDLVQALNTGHRGSLTTIHANSASDALRRVETLVLLGESSLPLSAVREQLASSIDLVVMTARGLGPKRRVVSVSEVPVQATAEWRLQPLAVGSTVVAEPSRGWWAT
jgi:pilus assembly protein CpaF